MPPRGVVYAVTGEIHRRYAQQSARRVRELHPDLPILVFTDEVAETEWPRNVEVREVADPAFSLRDKVEALAGYAADPAFDRTVYLDGDTWVCDDGALPDLFEVLDAAPLGLAMDEGRELRRVKPDFGVDVDAPTAVPMPNSGVMPFRPAAVADLFADWERRYGEHERADEPGVNDQPALREALVAGDCPWATFPPEYNLRITNVPRTYYGPARVVHSMASNLPDLAAELDGEEWQTVYPVAPGFPRDDEVELHHGPNRWRLAGRELRLRVRRDGFLGTARTALSALARRAVR